VGLVIFGQYARAALALGAAAVCGLIMVLMLRRVGWASFVR
jgi:hypothetical protein